MYTHIHWHTPANTHIYIYGKCVLKKLMYDIEVADICIFITKLFVV